KEQQKIIEKLSLTSKQNGEKARNLENINKKILLKYEEEKAVLNRIIKLKEEEIRKIRDTKMPEISRISENPEETSAEKQKPVVSRAFLPEDYKNAEAMSQMGLSHGDNVENIKKSLVSVGYEKEEIEKIIKRV
ncbi:hypothetical protein KY308_04150, partial [Candidatus Woesearchaeota archaeon]|nr:hypothetical protein [Candidatus Woesearchaeota archaeon]